MTPRAFAFPRLLVKRAASPPAATRSTQSDLEQRCRPALPVLAFSFGNIFHVVHVGARLGQHMVQIVADADEGKALFQELADAAGAEQEESENQIVLCAAFSTSFSVAARVRARCTCGGIRTSRKGPSTCTGRSGRGTGCRRRAPRRFPRCFQCRKRFPPAARRCRCC